MATTKKKIRVFYSWQSDLPSKTNRTAIGAALRTSKGKIETVTSDFEIIIDEATRDTSGSPNIALTILEKIDQADIFVADITTITSQKARRRCPNPNVGYELGYAVAQLGWPRVILVFNEAFGLFPKDLPFDFAQNRGTPYRFAESDPESVRVTWSPRSRHA